MTNVSVTKLVGDFIAFAALATLVLIFKVGVDPAEVGFFCDDNSIRYPFVPSTVSSVGLHIWTTVAPIVLIAAIEAVEIFVWEKNTQHRNDYVINNIQIHRYVARIYVILGYFCMGLFINQLFASVAKYTTGELRPYFVAVCRPDQGFERCNSSAFISEYKCTNSEIDEVSTSRLSFYSGHAASAFYAAVYLFFYMQGRLNKEPLARTALPTAQCFIFIMAFYISYTRISDYQHHVRDVIVGVFMGSAVAYFLVLRASSTFGGRLFSRGLPIEQRDGTRDAAKAADDSRPMTKLSVTPRLTTPVNSYASVHEPPIDGETSTHISDHIRRNVLVY